MKKITTLLICLISYLSAEIYEVQHFHEIKEHIDHETLILLDIDDTLLITEQMLGCDEWFIERLNKNGLEQSLAEWEAVRHLTKMKIVEPKTDALVKDLQNQGYQVMGLTTQGLALATRTKQQLAENNIDLSLTAPFKKDHYLSIFEHGVLYRSGTLYTSGMPKGESLFHLCDDYHYYPRKIVFINDKTTHLADVENAARERNVPFIGLRYAYADKHKAQYRTEIADLQFTRSTLAQLLSDEEATELFSIEKS